MVMTVAQALNWNEKTEWFNQKPDVIHYSWEIKS
jgi:hypothetical protein